MTWAGQSSDSGILSYEINKTPWINRGTLTLQDVEVFTSGVTFNLDSQNRRVVIRKILSSATVVNLPANPSVGQEIVIKDGRGDADLNNITLVGLNGYLIDGTTSIAIKNKYQSFTVLHDGEGWNIL